MKVHFTFLWGVFFIIAYFSHAMKTYLFLFAMLLIHESMHILIAKHLGLQVDQITVYPFGFGATINHLDHVPTLPAIAILLGGLGTHLLFPFVLRWMEAMHWISSVYCDYLVQLNFGVLFFNCCPIYPLDGGRILDAILHLFFNYAFARKLTLTLSIITYLLLLPLLRWNMVILFLFILFQLIRSIFEYQQERLHFYYYRYLHPLSLTNRKRRELYRNYSVILKRHDRNIQEQSWLKEMFSK